MGRIFGLLAMLVLGIGSVFVGPAAPACACSCIASTEAEHESRADVVFEGEAQRVEDFRGAGDGQVRVTFLVNKVSKGDLAGTAYVVTANNGAACGAELKAGMRYRIYAKSEPQFLTTTLCSGNRELSRAAQTGGAPAPGSSSGSAVDQPPRADRESGDAVPPVAKKSADYRPVAAAGAGLLLVAGGLIWVARRRRRTAS